MMSKLYILSINIAAVMVKGKCIYALLFKLVLVITAVQIRVKIQTLWLKYLQFTLKYRLCSLKV